MIEGEIKMKYRFFPLPFRLSGFEGFELNWIWRILGIII